MGREKSTPHVPGPSQSRSPRTTWLGLWLTSQDKDKREVPCHPVVFPAIWMPWPPLLGLSRAESMSNKDSQVAPAPLPSLEKLYPSQAESGPQGMLSNAQSLSTETVRGFEART